MEDIAPLTRGEPAYGSSFLGRAPLTGSLAAPVTELGSLLGRLGTLLYTKDYPVDQYVAWADVSGLFEVMERRGTVTVSDVCSDTRLNEEGADALLGVLSALKLATRSATGRFTLTADAREYCLRSSPYYIVDQLSAYRKPIPRPYFERHTGWLHRLGWRVKRWLPNFRFGSPQRLINQHARNLSACVAAVRSGEFTGVKCMVDIAGGTGTFAIPLALEGRVERIVLTELPQALDNIRPYLLEHGLQNRVELLGMNLFEYPWRIPKCDGMFIGNFLHGFRDEVCRKVCQEAYRQLAPGGKVWIHEMVWNANKDGPLVTALWNAAMRIGPGLQRTGQEIASILESAGFIDTYVVPTAEPFALIAGHKPLG